MNVAPCKQDEWHLIFVLHAPAMVNHEVDEKRKRKELWKWVLEKTCNP